jgi:hypothetical protein
MCPHVLASQELEPLLVESLKIELETADHVYVNWEPYYYMKRGCICENCKTSFQSFSGTPAEEVDNVWPDIVIDRQSTLHNRFASWQHGNVVKALEQATQKAGQALGKDSVAHFLISTSADFSPHADRHQWQNPNCYLDSVGQVILWGTGTKALPLGTVDLPWIIGQGFRGNQYEDVNALAAPFRKKSGKRHHPKFIFLPAVSFDGEGRLVYPKVFAFNTILTLFEGFQGHASYSENGVDARYFSARAHASHYLANFEDAALDGDPLWDVTVTPVSEIPVLTARGGELTVLYHKALTYKGQTILALGNDDLVPHYVRVQFTPAMNSDSVWLFDPVKRLALGGEKGFSSNQLRSGILIEVPPKDFVVLRSETERASVLQYGAHVESQIRLKERFEKIKTRLSRRAQAVTSFAD